MAVLGMPGWRNILLNAMSEPGNDDACEENRAIKPPELIQQIRNAKIMEFEQILLRWVAARPLSDGG